VKYISRCGPNRNPVPSAFTERLRELVHYDPTTGVFTRKVLCGGRVEGSIAGTLHCDGYLKFSVDNRLYLAHRLAWLFVYGEWPPNQIDHINGNRADNRIVNLRLATPAENSRNRRRHQNNISGFKGVIRQRAKWHAQIMVNGRWHRLGGFSTPEEAHAAYCEAAPKFHGEFARTK
jgi:hypothetical protein